MTLPDRDEAAGLRATNAALRARIAALEARLTEVERLAESDTLTPLPNRRAFEREFGRMLARSVRYGIPAFVLFVDMDGLKLINDTYGHSAGDRALRHAADVLRRHIRQTDMVARIGGDEFGILLDHIEEEAALAKLDTLLDAMAEAPLELGGKPVRIGLSIGCSRVTIDDTVEAALARADRQMYTLKAAQRSLR